MKPSPFDYVKPASLDEALSLLGESDGEVAILAGGQSLMPTLNMRLSSPSLLIDINGIRELDGIEVVDDVIRIGALTRHQVVQTSAEVAQRSCNSVFRAAKAWPTGDSCSALKIISPPQTDCT